MMTTIEPEKMREILTASLAARYYDLAQTRDEVLTDLGNYTLKELEIAPGKYELSYDYLGDLETAANTFGLTELGIEQVGDPVQYKLGDQEAASIGELEYAPERLAEYADQVAKDLNERLDLPGAFYFSFESQVGSEGFRLYYTFEEADVARLIEAGAPIKTGVKKASASFPQIMAALEKEGLHDEAKKLHAILREG